MEIQGKIIQVLNEVKGIGKNGNPWSVLPFVLETNDQYPRKVYIEIFGDDRIKNCVNAVSVGNSVNVGIDIESNEYNGKWFTKVRAWKVELEDGNGNVIKPEAEDPMDAGTSSDLPF